MTTFSTKTTRLSCLKKWSTSTSITTRTTTAMYRTWTGFRWITTWNAIALITNSIWIGWWKTIDKRFARRLNTNDHIYNTEDISRDDKQQKYWWFHVMRAYDRLMMLMIFYIYFDLRQLLLSVPFLLFFPRFVFLCLIYSSIFSPNDNMDERRKLLFYIVRHMSWRAYRQKTNYSSVFVCSIHQRWTKNVRRNFFNDLLN